MTDLSKFQYYRVLDANTYEKLHRVLVTYLGRCTIIIVGELTFVDDDLARAFCSTSLAEHAKLLVRDHIYKVNYICTFEWISKVIFG